MLFPDCFECPQHGVERVTKDQPPRAASTRAEDAYSQSCLLEIEIAPSRKLLCTLYSRKDSQVPTLGQGWQSLTVMCPQPPPSAPDVLCAQICLWSPGGDNLGIWFAKKDTQANPQVALFLTLDDHLCPESSGQWVHFCSLLFFLVTHKLQSFDHFSRSPKA